MSPGEPLSSCQTRSKVLTSTSEPDNSSNLAVLTDMCRPVMHNRLQFVRGTKAKVLFIGRSFGAARM